MNFKHVVVGWEWASHDSRVLMEIIRYPQHNFFMPPSSEYFFFFLFLFFI